MCPCVFLLSQRSKKHLVGWVSPIPQADLVSGKGLHLVLLLKDTVGTSLQLERCNLGGRWHLGLMGRELQESTDHMSSCNKSDILAVLWAAESPLYCLLTSLCQLIFFLPLGPVLVAELGFLFSLSWVNIHLTLKRQCFLKFSLNNTFYV